MGTQQQRMHRDSTLQNYIQTKALSDLCLDSTVHASNWQVCISLFRDSNAEIEIQVISYGLLADSTLLVQSVHSSSYPCPVLFACLIEFLLCERVVLQPQDANGRAPSLLRRNNIAQVTDLDPKVAFSCLC